MAASQMILQTAAGNDIEHTQDLEVGDDELLKLPAFHKRFGPLIERASPTGSYNCHGMTFALRRAWVFGEGRTIEMILADDKYTEILDIEDVLAGDVILYFGEREEGVIHSGLVVEVTKTVPKSALVCSKWAHSAEFLHWANNTPYGNIVKYFRVKR